MAGLVASNINPKNISPAGTATVHTIIITDCILPSISNEIVSWIIVPAAILHKVAVIIIKKHIINIVIKGTIVFEKIFK